MSAVELSSDGAPRTYAELRRAVERVLVHHQREIDIAQVMVYWTTGDFIHRHVMYRGDRAEYGAQVITRLAEELGRSRRLIYRCLEFRRKYDAKIVSARTQLLWAHFRLLMLIEDTQKRAALEEVANSQGWTSAQLEERVRPLLLAQAAAETLVASPRRVEELLVPRLGSAGLYRMVPGADSLAVDLGFTSFFELKAEQAAEFKQGDIVRIDDTGRVSPAVEAKPADLHTYRADCLRVIDGDTIWLRVHLRPRHWLKEKVRLRGLDCPEIDTTEGRAAKRFTEQVMNRAKSVTISTTKPDKFDRYLADVHLDGDFAQVSSQFGETVFLNNALLENGHAIRKDRWSVDDWENDDRGVPK